MQKSKAREDAAARKAEALRANLKRRKKAARKDQATLPAPKAQKGSPNEMPTPDKAK